MLSEREMLRETLREKDKWAEFEKRLRFLKTPGLESECGGERRGREE